MNLGVIIPNILKGLPQTHSIGVFEHVKQEVVFTLFFHLMWKSRYICMGKPNHDEMFSQSEVFMLVISIFALKSCLAFGLSIGSTLRVG